MNRKKSIKYIATHYGYKSQSRQCVEEMAELMQAICKLERAATNDDYLLALSHMQEEIADVEIMIAQLKVLSGTDVIEKIIDRKIKRQLKRIEKEKGTC